MNPEVTSYYLRVMSNYGSFFVPAIDSTRQAFYIELNGFIGAIWDIQAAKIKPGRHEDGSLYKFLFVDCKRQKEKKIPKEMFEKLLRQEAEPLERLNNLRHNLAHFKELKVRNSKIITNYDETKRILDGLAEIIYKLGYQRGNSPDHYEDDNPSSKAVQEIIDKLTIGKDRQKMRDKYLFSRKEWMNR